MFFKGERGQFRDALLGQQRKRKLLSPRARRDGVLPSPSVSQGFKGDLSTSEDQGSFGVAAFHPDGGKSPAAAAEIAVSCAQAVISSIAKLAAVI